MEYPIAMLADETLAAIFEHLPPFERLIASEVCSKWREISQAPWRDVTRLDLSQVPTQNIHAVIKKCPKLVSVSALRQNLGDIRRFISRFDNFSTLNCQECSFALPLRCHPSVDHLVRNSSLAELIWHNSETIVVDYYGVSKPQQHQLPFLLPSSLVRVQISGVNSEHVVSYLASGCFFSLPLLECFIIAFANLQSPPEPFLFSVYPRWTVSSLWESANLRELYLDTPAPSVDVLKVLFLSLQGLQVLFLHNDTFQPHHLNHILTQHRSLRILVLTASRVSDFVGKITLLVRKLFPKGFNSPPVPPLHLFLGKIAAEKLRFYPQTDALKIYPINAPLPEFLEKEEIKQIFEGSWIASRIKEGAKDGANLTDYSFEGNAESIHYVHV